MKIAHDDADISRTLPLSTGLALAWLWLRDATPLRHCPCAAAAAAAGGGGGLFDRWSNCPERAHLIYYELLFTVLGGVFFFSPFFPESSMVYRVYFVYG